jgi:hypothetical protein
MISQTDVDVAGKRRLVSVESLVGKSFELE